jgi:hypothetical protein
MRSNYVSIEHVKPCLELFGVELTQHDLQEYNASYQDEDLHATSLSQEAALAMPLHLY